MKKFVLHLIDFVVYALQLIVRKEKKKIKQRETSEKEDDADEVAF